MEITFKPIILVILTALTGLSAGLCFTWTNAVTPGIGRLNDLQFLSAFQQMNRAILNPLFYTIFIGPFFCGLVNLYLFKEGNSKVFGLLIAAFFIYLLGVLAVTILGNIPLNEMLDKINLDVKNTKELSSLRHDFETPWNRLHFIRTLCSTSSFIILIISLIEINKNQI